VVLEEQEIIIGHTQAVAVEPSETMAGIVLVRAPQLERLIKTPRYPIFSEKTFQRVEATLVLVE
tara:strand:- start:417 stop:608 length:192 start_codon:yes stop_codon:yes gene_type:complete